MTSTPPPPPPANSGTMDGFFNSLRRMNTPRSQDRWIGGVAGGIAARLGVDPLIMRGVFLVITLFGGFGLLVYGLGWALLPETSDGRIHLQEAIRGRFDAALAGAILFAVVGLSRVGFWWDGWVGIPFMIGMIALVALVVVIIAATRGKPVPPAPGSSAPFSTAEHTSGGSVPFSTAHPASSGSVPFSAAQAAETAAFPAAGAAGSAAPGDPAAESAPSSTPEAEGPWAGAGPWPATDAPAADSATGADAPATSADATPTAAYPGATTHPTYPNAAGYAPTAGQTPTPDTTWSAGAGAPPPQPPPPFTPPPPHTPPPPPRPTRPGPGSLLVRATFGVALLAIAVLAVLPEYYAWPPNQWLIALGGALVVLGLGATIAGLLGRRSSSLGVIGTLLAIVLIPWSISAPAFSNYNFTDSASYGERTWEPATAAEAAEGFDDLAAGSLVVDLSQLTDEQVAAPIEIDLGAGEVDLRIPDGMPVIVSTSVMGETTAVNLTDWSAEANGDTVDLSRHTRFGWRLGSASVVLLSSPESYETTPITVHVDVGVGEIQVRELP